MPINTLWHFMTGTRELIWVHSNLPWLFLVSALPLCSHSGWMYWILGNWYNKKEPVEPSPWGHRKVLGGSGWFLWLTGYPAAYSVCYFAGSSFQAFGTVSSLHCWWISVNVWCWRSTVCAEVDECHLIFFTDNTDEGPGVRGCGGLWRNS